MTWLMPRSGTKKKKRKNKSNNFRQKEKKNKISVHNLFKLIDAATKKKFT